MLPFNFYDITHDFRVSTISKIVRNGEAHLLATFYLVAIHSLTQT